MDNLPGALKVRLSIIAYWSLQMTISSILMRPLPGIASDDAEAFKSPLILMPRKKKSLLPFPSSTN